MKKSSARFLHVSNLLVAGTGIAWAYFAYVAGPGEEPADPELLLDWTGVHPLVPGLRTAHLFTAPLLVFAVGLIWMSHVQPRLMRKWARRATGLSLALLVAPMVLSGIGLQTAASPEARELWLWAHLGTSGAWVVAFLVHLLTPSAKRRA